MAKRDYYEVLGLSKGASEAEIKKAYRRLARKLHPDVNPGDKAAQKRFQEAQEAYDVLKDDDKRRAYDRFGHAGPGGGFDPRTAGGPGFPPGGFPGGFGRGGGTPFEGIHFESGDLGDLFGNLFGGRRSSGPDPGEDLRGQIEVPFRDAVLGGTATLSLRREKPCPTCGGSGRTAMSFYWGRTLGRAAEEAKPVFEATEAFNHAANPTTKRRSNWNDFQGWCIPAQNNPFIDEVRQALVYQQTSKDWLIKYCHSLMPNVAPTYKDIADAPELKEHAFYKSKPRTVDTYFRTSLANSSSTANELLQGVNPLAGIVHGRSVLAQTVQKVVIDNMKPQDAAKWGAKELSDIRRENIRLLG